MDNHTYKIELYKPLVNNIVYYACLYYCPVSTLVFTTVKKLIQLNHL
jgi:hypothetical protein